MNILIATIILTNAYIGMQSDFNYCFNKLVSDRYEGHEYTCDPDDLGGATKYGITENTARAHGYTGDMKALPKDLAKKIYKNSYWDIAKCELLPNSLAFEVFEVSVHAGIRNNGSSKSVEILQEVINLFSEIKIKIDGILGVETISVMNCAISRYSEKQLKLWYNILQGSFYFEIAKNNPSQAKFLRGGWTNRLEFK